MISFSLKTNTNLHLCAKLQCSDTAFFFFLLISCEENVQYFPIADYKHNWPTKFPLLRKARKCFGPWSFILWGVCGEQGTHVGIILNCWFPLMALLEVDF